MTAGDVLKEWMKEWGYGDCLNGSGNMWQLHKRGVTINIVTHMTTIYVNLGGQTGRNRKVDLHDPGSKDQLWKIIDDMMWISMWK